MRESASAIPRISSRERFSLSLFHFADHFLQVPSAPFSSFPFTFLAHFFIIIQRKAYGAGLLSSFGELEYSMGANAEKPKVLTWDPFDAAGREYPITTYQYVSFLKWVFCELKHRKIRFGSGNHTAKSMWMWM